MVWRYEKFKGDGAIYAFCPECGFYHSPTNFNVETMQCEVKYQYNYCPMCGVYLRNEKAYTDGIDVIWNERDIEELWG